MIHVESQPGAGATFVMDLPTGQAPLSLREEDARTSHPS